MSAKQNMIGKIAALTTDQILEGVTAIGGGHVSTEQRMVRAYLIEEYATREGRDAADVLMDTIGL